MPRNLCTALTQVFGQIANSVDPDWTPHYVVCDPTSIFSQPIGGRMDLFRFYDKFGKGLRCPII